MTTEGEDYYIDTAEQFVENAKLSGVYHIKKDLTFTDEIKWPATFTYGNFSGKIFSEKSGNVVTVSGISVSNTSFASGGLFGTLTASAVIKDVNFKDVSVSNDVKGTIFRTNEGYFGLFAGLVRKGAKIENVMVSGTLTVGGNCLITTGKDGNSYVNAYANCDNDDYSLLSGLKKETVIFKVTGEKYNDSYLYSLNTNKIEVDRDTYAITFEKYGKAEKFDFKEYTQPITPEA